MKWSISFNSPSQASGANATQLSPGDQAKINAAITQMETQLQDPNVQSNPTLKATLEQRIQMMKSMQSGGSTGGMGSMLKGFTIKIKNGNTLTHMEGSLSSNGDVLRLKSIGKTYLIKNDSKTYSVQPPPATNTKQGITKVVPTSETRMILSYNCTKYTVTVTRDTSVQTMFMWVTKDLKEFDYKSFHDASSGGDQSTAEALSKLDGAPLRIESNRAGRMFTMEVTEITKQALPDSDFSIPADYTEVPYGH